MIVLPITQLQMILSMAIAEILLLSDPNYTVRIGSETYFSLAVGAFVGSIFIFTLIAFKIGSIIKFKDTVKEKLIVNQS
jgi:large-conductance mechanosensitive channel